MSETTPEWVDLRHAETGGTHRVPNDESVLTHFAARGWEPYTPDEAPPFVPSKDTPSPSLVPGDRSGFVTLGHPDLDATHDFPNNPEALAGAHDRGWSALNADGSIPKRQKPLDALAAPEPARAPRQRTRAATENADTAPVPDEQDPSTDRPADTAATENEE